MLQTFWQWLRQLWQRLQRWFGHRPAADLPPTPAPSPASTRSAAEYEALFLALLDNPELTSGRFKGWLISKNLTEDDLMAWLQQFGDRLQANPDQHQELAQRLIQFGSIVNGPTAQSALQLGKKIYAPPPEPEPGEWDVIEAVFKGNPLGA